MIQGLKELTSRDNVVELVVGVVIGAVFKSIVDVLTDGTISPFIAAVIDRPDFSDTFILILNSADVKSGVLIFAVINFLLMTIASYLCITVLMNALSKHMKKQAVVDETEAEANEEESDEVKLLTEIRSILAQGTPCHWASDPSS